jgi:hypothetical protein
VMGVNTCSVGHAGVRAHSQHCDIRAAASAASNRRNLVHERGSTRSLGHYSEKSTPPDNILEGHQGRFTLPACLGLRTGRGTAGASTRRLDHTLRLNRAA